MFRTLFGTVFLRFVRLRGTLSAVGNKMSLSIVDGDGGLHYHMRECDMNGHGFRQRQTPTA